MNRMSLAAALAAASLVACARDRGTTTHPVHAGSATTATPPVIAAPPAHPSDADCARLVEHAIALELHDPATAKSSDRALTEADVAEVARAVTPAAQATCRAMTIAAFHCALAATTVEAFGACD